MKNIYLVGFMGSGKSHHIKSIADEFSLKPYDLDDYIEMQEKKSIGQIFETSGEFFFREIENKYLQKILQKKNVVLACGGGTPCFFDNMNLINAAGISVWLNEDINIIVERLKKEKEKRPLLKEKNDAELFLFVEKKMNERKNFYAQAQIEIKHGDDIIEKIKTITLL